MYDHMCHIQNLNTFSKRNFYGAVYCTINFAKGIGKGRTFTRYMVDLYFATVVYEHDNVCGFNQLPECIYWKSTEVMSGGRVAVCLI